MISERKRLIDWIDNNPKKILLIPKIISQEIIHERPFKDLLNDGTINDELTIKIFDDVTKLNYNFRYLDRYHIQDGND